MSKLKMHKNVNIYYVFKINLLGHCWYICYAGIDLVISIYILLDFYFSLKNINKNNVRTFITNILRQYLALPHVNDQH